MEILTSSILPTFFGLPLNNLPYDEFIITFIYMLAFYIIRHDNIVRSDVHAACSLVLSISCIQFKIPLLEKINKCMSVAYYIVDFPSSYRYSWVYPIHHLCSIYSLLVIFTRLKFPEHELLHSKVMMVEASVPFFNMYTRNKSINNYILCLSSMLTARLIYFPILIWILSKKYKFTHLDEQFMVSLFTIGNTYFYFNILRKFIKLLKQKYS